MVPGWLSLNHKPLAGEGVAFPAEQTNSNNAKEPFYCWQGSMWRWEEKGCGLWTLQQELLETPVQQSHRLPYDFLSYEDFWSVLETELSCAAEIC